MGLNRAIYKPVQNTRSRPSARPYRQTILRAARQNVTKAARLTFQASQITVQAARITVQAAQITVPAARITV